MNNVAHQQAVQAACKKKFRGRRKLKCKGAMHYPHGVERDYKRVVNEYMVMLNKILAEHLPTIRKAIADERRGMRQDWTSGVTGFIAQMFMRIQRDLEIAATKFDLAGRIRRIAGRSQRFAIRQWKNVVHSTLGINLLDDYYKGDFLGNAMELWVQDNVNLIKSIPQNTLNDMQNIVLEGYKNGTLNRDISKQIQDVYGVSKSKAQFLARDQTAKLNSDISKEQFKDAGVEEYIWRDSDDERVRPRHEQLDGTVQRLDDPPIVDIRTGCRGHPGEDYSCRCVKLPIFDFLGIDLPWFGGKNEQQV